MNDKIKINLQIADSNYPLTINREEEQTVREAAKQVNIRLNKYREVYKNLEPEKIIDHTANHHCFTGDSVGHQLGTEGTVIVQNHLSVLNTFRIDRDAFVQHLFFNRRIYNIPGSQFIIAMTMP